MPDGAVVNPVNLVGIMKNLKVIRVTDSSVLVDGWKREDAEAGWEHFRGYLSTSIKVTMAEDDMEEPVKKEKIVKIPGAGRQKSPPIVLDFPERFTMKELSVKYPEIPKHKLYILTQDAIKLGKVNKVGEIKAKKGKNTIIYGLTGQ